MYETAFQAPGRFDVELKPDTPEEIKALTARAFAGIIITPSPVLNPNKLTYADLRSRAVYFGVHTERSKSRTTFAGYGLAWLLTRIAQEEDQQVARRPLYDGSNTSWIRNNVLRLGVTENNGITAGTISSAASPTKPGKIDAGQTSLEVLADVCRRFSVNWRVNPDGTLDVGASLFVTSPTTVATPIGGGRDLNVTGLPSVAFDETDDWEDYATEVVVPFKPKSWASGTAYVANDTVVLASTGVVYECTTGHTSNGTNAPPNASFWAARASYGTSTPTSNPYVNPITGTAMKVRRVVTGRNATMYDDAVAIADQQLGRFDQPQREITLSTSAYEVHGAVEAGDVIYVYDVDNDLYSTANQVVFGGRTIFPASVRVTAVREALSSDKGVYCRSWDGSAQVTHDLTPYVAWEPAGATLELGEPRRLRSPSAVAV